MVELQPTTYDALYNTDNPVEGIATYQGNYSVFVRVLSSKATTKAELLAWLNGKSFIYQLNTPVTYVLDTPIYLGFHSVNGGVIRQIPQNGAAPSTAPIPMDVTYPVGVSSLITDTSQDNLLKALKTAGVISNYTTTYDPATGQYNYTITK